MLQYLETWDEQCASRQHSLAIESQKANSDTAESLIKWANLVVANLGSISPKSTRITVQDYSTGDGHEISLELDPSKGSAKEQADIAFKKARKLRRGREAIEKLAKENVQLKEILGSWRTSIESTDDLVALERLQQLMSRKTKKLRLKTMKKNKKIECQDVKKMKFEAEQQFSRQTEQLRLRAKIPTEWKGRVFDSPNGVPILVGRNKSENEFLSTRIAKHPDVWFHAHDTPGAHVVLRLSVTDKLCPEDDCLQMSADLAAFYSDSRNTKKTLVTQTSPKHITKPKYAPLGAVALRKINGTINARPTDSVYIPQYVKDIRAKEEKS